MSAVDQLNPPVASAGPDDFPTPVPMTPAMPHPVGPLANAIAAVKAGISVQEMRELMMLQREFEANEARKAYVDAMATFKRNPPTIIKDKLVSYTTDRGGLTAYHHAAIGQVVQKISEGLAEYGFSHRWNTEQDNGNVIVTCTITHRAGHSESTTLRAAPDSSGGKNGIQSIASAVTYLQRYTLLAATGLATIDQEDDDGEGAEGEYPLTQKWLSAAEAAESADALKKVWTDGLAEIRPTKDMALYESFKQAVTARGEQIKARDAQRIPSADEFTQAYEKEESKNDRH